MGNFVDSCFGKVVCMLIRWKWLCFGKSFGYEFFYVMGCERVLDCNRRKLKCIEFDSEGNKDVYSWLCVICSIWCIWIYC